ncbi:DNA-directed RNA polymerases I and III subunit RPAC1 [Sarcoptes scabiei]|nr:DNA-directed RNA polymerases I and III subunit RPAC1 [Sarcoptes scabiei]
MNADYSFANSIRRILLAEVCTMAIEKIDLYQNTSEVPDFALCHRLGLIPIRIPKNFFNLKHTDQSDMLKFKLEIQCHSDQHNNLNVYSNALEWLPEENQLSMFADDPPRPADDDILVIKLAPGQKVDAILHCSKGNGKMHAKYSPVSACYYSHLTLFDFVHKFQNPETNCIRLEAEELEKLKLFFPPGHCDYKSIDENGFPRIISNRFNRSDFIFQSCPSLREKICFKTDKNILAFTVESVGTMEPVQLIIQSISIIRSKCQKLLQTINNLNN